ncbi:MAG TPA: Gfo/Idh/MocA family oxidoreductase [Planctomycetota bacterium]|nr:Gfo/Idh/MocA family oxidoreductase [Planctomycetota bacterium]
MATKKTGPFTVMMAGCGGRSHSHFETLVAHPETWTVTGLIDPSAESRAKVKARFPKLAQAGEFATLAEALKTSVPAVVFISSASGFHYALSKEALAAGCHVICEKPLTFEVKEAQDLVKRAAKAKRRLFVTHNYRHMPATLALQAAVAENHLGRIGAFSIRFHRRRDPIAAYSIAEPAPLLWIQAIHQLDMMRAVFGEVATVSAVLANPAWSPYKHETVVRATFKMKSGVIGSYEGSYRAFGRQTPYDGEWRVECEQGDLLLFCGVNGLVEERLPEDGAARHATEQRPVPMPPSDPQTRMIQGIAEALRTGKAFCTEAADNVKTLRLIEAILESGRTNKVVVA